MMNPLSWDGRRWRGLLVALVLTWGAAASVSSLPSPLARNRVAIAGFARRYDIPGSLAGTIYRESRALGVEPEVVFGLIQVESGFDPRAIGSQGERGLTQIKPATARAYDRSLTPERLMDPAVNVRIGLRHLLEEVRHFEGDWTLGLQAYHRGRTGLRRALARGGRPDTAYAARILAHCDGPPS